MSLKEFELFHGSVLTKLVRRDSNITLSLVETDKESWAIYRVNDTDIFVKHSSTPRALKTGKSWVFSFVGNQLAQVRDKRPHVALVCGGKTPTAGGGICFLNAEQMDELLANEAQSVVTVRLTPGQQFRVSSGATSQPFKIPRTALEKFDIPA